MTSVFREWIWTYALLVLMANRCPGLMLTSVFFATGVELTTLCSTSKSLSLINVDSVNIPRCLKMKVVFKLVKISVCFKYQTQRNLWTTEIFFPFKNITINFHHTVFWVFCISVFVTLHVFLLYPTHGVAECIMFLTRPSVSQSVSQSCFSCQHNSSDTAQQNFVKLCGYEGHNV